MHDRSTVSLLGQKMHDLARELYPLCRSITGDGVRQTLHMLQEIIPLEVHEVPSGSQVFDWTIPKEWNIREAWIKDPDGQKIVDFKANNLHVLNYSMPYKGILGLAELKRHLYSLPDKPDWIPYRTSYYQEQWGFCMTHSQLEALADGLYEVFVDTSLTQGSLTYGELLIPGEKKEEFLFSTHICHPSLANDNLSGIAVLTYLASILMNQKNRFSYRFLFIPGTIGSICWLAQNESKLSNIKGGLVASLLGDGAPFHFKKSRQGISIMDQVVSYVLDTSGHPFEILDFIPYGYDERQFCSPGINLAVGNLTRSIYGYPEYHTSADDLQFISATELSRSMDMYWHIAEVWDQNVTYLNLLPKGEPQLGRRGLYHAIGGENDKAQLQMALLWVLNYSDGLHSLLDIARISKLTFDTVHKAANLLEAHQLIKEV